MSETGIETKEGIMNIVRLSVLVVSLVAMIVFYIRWNDRWAQMHASEEFRLKRLDLDIDRASWVAEVAMEWQVEQGGEMPQALLDCLSRNLFVDDPKSETTSHPYEDAFRAFLGISAEAKVPLPGGTEVRVKKKGLQAMANKS